MPHTYGFSSCAVIVASSRCLCAIPCLFIACVWPCVRAYSSVFCRCVPCVLGLVDVCSSFPSCVEAKNKLYQGGLVKTWEYTCKSRSIGLSGCRLVVAAKGMLQRHGPGCLTDNRSAAAQARKLVCMRVSQDIFLDSRSPECATAAFLSQLYFVGTVVLAGSQ